MGYSYKYCIKYVAVRCLPCARQPGHGMLHLAGRAFGVQHTLQWRNPEYGAPCGQGTLFAGKAYLAMETGRVWSYEDLGHDWGKALPVHALAACSIIGHGQTGTSLGIKACADSIVCGSCNKPACLTINFHPSWRPLVWNRMCSCLKEHAQQISTSPSKLELGSLCNSLCISIGLSEV